MSRGEGELHAVAELELQHARSVWPHLVHATAAARSLQSDIRQFEGRLMHASRAIVTPVIVLACTAVFLVMVASGVSWQSPQTAQLLAWGADSGKGVIIDHEYWRLFTSMFIHVGLWHLLMNMFCLATAGPLVERLFGHLGFLALYVLSGLGGSILSVWWQPMTAGAGASGAIFGVFGGLLGFLAIRHREVPFAILKPMRGGAIGFVAFNTFFSAVIPGISMSAHMGGLVTGFVCGLLMTAVAPADARARLGVLTALQRAGVAVLVGAGLLVLGYSGLPSSKARMLADPARAIHELATASVQVYSQFNHIQQGIEQLESDVNAGRLGKRQITDALGRLKSESESLAARIQALPAANSGLLAMRDELAAAQLSQRKMLDSLERFVATGDDKHIDGPDGFRASVEAYAKHHERLESLTDAYVKAHHLQVNPSGKKSKP